MPESVLGYGILAALGLLFAFSLWRTVRKRGTGCCDGDKVPVKATGQGATGRDKPGSGGH